MDIMEKNPPPEAKLPLDESNFSSNLVDIIGSRAPIVYLCHAISGPLAAGFEAWLQHEEDVRNTAIELANAGFVPIVPQDLGPNMTWEEALRLDKSLVYVADALFVHTSDYPSRGVELEISWGKERGIPVCETIEELIDALHPTR